LSWAINALEETETARNMLARGATRGMVDQYLRRQGLNEFTRLAVVQDAAKSLNTLSRLKSLLMAIAGLMIIGGGIEIQQECQQLQAPGPELPAAVVLCGLAVGVWGLFGVVQRRF
jgi:hypothetical protein